MTTVALEYLKHQEAQRHNAVVEAEQKRANIESERLKEASIAESRRAAEAALSASIAHNVAMEDNTRAQIRNAKEIAQLDRTQRIVTASADRQSREDIAGQQIKSQQAIVDVQTQTQKETTGINSLTNLFNTLMGFISGSKKKKK